MKFRIFIICIISLVFSAYVNCSIGTKADACKAELKRDFSSGFCEVLSLAPLANNSEANVSRLNELVIGCLLYYKNLEECNKSENKRTPALYSKE